MNITISLLDNPIAAADWHDKPLKWAVNGPGEELQVFRTKKDAELYRRLRKGSASFNEAQRRFIAAP